MGSRILGKSCSLLLVVLIAACQNPTAPSSSETIPTVQASEVAPYPFATIESTSSSGLTPNPTSISQNTQTPTLVNVTTSTPLPENTQTIQYFQPKCSQEDYYLQCTDSLLNLQYKYPSRWGLVNAELVNGSCGGLYYSYRFDRPNSGVEGGGVSADYCNQMGGNLFSLFKGFQPGQGCNEFPQARDCQQITDWVVIGTFYPDFRSICEPGPGTITMPVMIIGMSIPGDHPVAGLVFTADFLSIKGTDQLYEPFGGVLINTGKCLDPKTEEIYTQLVEDISNQVRLGTFDEETNYKVKGIIDFANSIALNP